MSVPRLVLRSRRVVTPDGMIAADVVIDGERIAGVEPFAGTPQQTAVVEDLGDLVLMPGIVDVHVHINEPGRTEWEGFAHATRAAGVGGVTMLADMPLNSDPVTIDVPSLAFKQVVARGQCHVDVGLYAGLVPENARRPVVLGAIEELGVLGWKTFLCDSGLDSFQKSSRDELEAAMPVLATADARLLAHAEIADVTAASRPIRSYREWEASRPGLWEIRAIELLIELSRRTRCAVHVVHLSTATALPMLRQARAEGLPITVETCPHYLHFAVEDLPDGDARFKCAPPIRGAANREALWRALEDGDIDLIASDHSPCPPEMKATPGGDLAAAWGGIASIQLTLPVVWSGARSRGIAIERVARWLCERPAELLGLQDEMGTIAEGRLANLVAWDPDSSFAVDPSQLLFRHPQNTPYAGVRLHGRVERTWLRGGEVARAGETIGPPTGRVMDPPISPALDALYGLAPDEMREALARCCAATAWIEPMLDSMIGSWAPPGLRAKKDLEPLRNSLTSRSEDAFKHFTRADWLEAFAGHPRIGDLDSLRHRFSSTAALASAEQAGARDASDRVLRALAQGNEEYERRFGHIFIVCASGKSADEMLAILHQRMGNHPTVELEVAAGEQRKITRLRLAALVAQTGVARGSIRPRPGTPRDPQGRPRE
jgi:allantoinase